MSRPEVAPVRTSLTVNVPPRQAFRLFTEEMGSWWPLETHSMTVDEQRGPRAETVAVEPREGGRIIERTSDGTEVDWGRILVWEPPARLVMSWKPNRSPHPPTEVEVTFSADGDQTRVELEHRGWERLGADAEEGRANYDAGWPGVLERFAAAAAR